MAHFTLKASLKASHGLRLAAAMPRQNNIVLTICQCRGSKLDPRQMKIKKINGQIKSLTIIFTDKNAASVNPVPTENRLNDRQSKQLTPCAVMAQGIPNCRSWLVDTKTKLEVY